MFVLLGIIPFVLHTTLAANTYTVTFGDSQKQCVKCPPGSYVVKDCHQDDTYSTICGPCPTGRYTQAWNAYHSCKPCRKHCYGANEIITTECRPDHDITCGCPPEFWRENHGTPGAKCLPFLKCGKGYGVDKAGTNLSDVTCTPCISGVNYSAVISNSEVCQPCRDCQKEGWNQTDPCTVFANAECDVTTTSEPTFKTTTGSQSSTPNTHPAEENPSKIVVVITSIVCAAVLICLVAVAIYFGYKCWKDRHQENKYLESMPRNNSYSNEVFERVNRPDDTSIAGSRSSFQSVNLETLRRRISSLFLQSDITLENDVFPWISSKLGKRFVSICKSLPGEGINQVDLEAAEYKYGRQGLSDVIAEVFRIWREKNILRGEDALFTDIYSTLVYAKEHDLSWKMRQTFARY